MVLKEKIVNIETGEETWRDYTPEEMAAVETAKAIAEAYLAEAQAKEAARKAVLEKLGLTADEAAALLG